MTQETPGDTSDDDDDKATVDEDDDDVGEEVESLVIVTAGV